MRYKINKNWSYRYVAWHNLKNTMRFMRHINQGIKSGYPSCCILWYFIRSLINEIGMLIFNIDKFFDLNLSNEHKHVACPICRVRKKKFKYYKCEKCKWIQANNKICNKCK